MVVEISFNEQLSSMISGLKIIIVIVGLTEIIIVVGLKIAIVGFKIRWI